MVHILQLQIHNDEDRLYLFHTWYAHYKNECAQFAVRKAIDFTVIMVIWSHCKFFPMGNTITHGVMCFSKKDKWTIAFISNQFASFGRKNERMKQWETNFVSRNGWKQNWKLKHKSIIHLCVWNGIGNKLWIRTNLIQSYKQIN